MRPPRLLRLTLICQACGETFSLSLLNSWKLVGNEAHIRITWPTRERAWLRLLTESHRGPLARA